MYLHSSRPSFASSRSSSHSSAVPRLPRSRLPVFAGRIISVNDFICTNCSTQNTIKNLLCHTCGHPRIEVAEAQKAESQRKRTRSSGPAPAPSDAEENEEKRATRNATFIDRTRLERKAKELLENDIITVGLGSSVDSVSAVSSAVEPENQGKKSRKRFRQAQVKYEAESDNEAKTEHESVVEPVESVPSTPVKSRHSASLVSGVLTPSKRPKPQPIGKSIAAAASPAPASSLAADSDSVLSTADLVLLSSPQRVTRGKLNEILKPAENDNTTSPNKRTPSKTRSAAVSPARAAAEPLAPPPSSPSKLRSPSKPASPSKPLFPPNARDRISALQLCRDFLQISCSPPSSSIEGRKQEQSMIERFLRDQILARKGGSIYISGSPGTGKSYCVDCSLDIVFGSKAPKLNQQRIARRMEENEKEQEAQMGEQREGKGRTKGKSNNRMEKCVIANSVSVDLERLESGEPAESVETDSVSVSGRKRGIGKRNQSDKMQIRVVTFNAMQLNNPRDVYPKLFSLCHSSHSLTPSSSASLEFKSKEQAKAALGSLFAPSLDSLVRNPSTGTLIEPDSKGNSMYVIVLDELDSLLSSSAAGPNEILANLFEWSSTAHSRLILVGISNSVDLTDSSASTKSSQHIQTSRDRDLKPDLTLIFRSYTTDQLLSIVNQRISMIAPHFNAKTSNYNPQIPLFHPFALKFCAMKVAQRSGDVRKCLEICGLALDRLLMRIRQGKVKESEGLQVSFARMNRVLHSILPSSVHEWIGQLPDHQKVILCLLALYHYRHKRYPTVAELQKLNQSRSTSMTSNWGFPSFSTENFHEMIQNLQVSGLVTLHSMDSEGFKGSRGSHASGSKMNAIRSKLWSSTVKSGHFQSNSVLSMNKTLDQLIDALDVKESNRGAEADQEGKTQQVEEIDTDEEEQMKKSGRGGANHEALKPTVFHLKLIRAKEFIDHQLKQQELDSIRSQQIENNADSIAIEKKFIAGGANSGPAVKKRLTFDKNFQYSNPLLL